MEKDYGLEQATNEIKKNFELFSDIFVFLRFLSSVNLFFNDPPLHIGEEGKKIERLFYYSVDAGTQWTPFEKNYYLIHTVRIYKEISELISLDFKKLELDPPIYDHIEREFHEYSFDAIDMIQTIVNLINDGKLHVPSEYEPIDLVGYSYNIFEK